MEYLTLQDVPRYHRTSMSYPAPAFLGAGTSRLAHMSEVSSKGSFATTHRSSIPINTIVSSATTSSLSSESSSALSSPEWEAAKPYERHDSVMEALEASKPAHRAEWVEQHTLPPLSAPPGAQSSRSSCKCSCSTMPSHHEYLESSYQYQRHQAGYPRNNFSDKEKSIVSLPPVHELMDEVDRRRSSKSCVQAGSLAHFASSNRLESTSFPGSHNPFEDDYEARQNSSKRHRESLQPSSYTYTSLPDRSLDRPQYPQSGSSFDAAEYHHGFDSNHSSTYNSPRTIPANNSPLNGPFQSLQPRSPPSSIPSFSHRAPAHASETVYQNSAQFEPSTNMVVHRTSYPTEKQGYGTYEPVSPTAKGALCIRNQNSYRYAGPDPGYNGPRQHYPYPGENSYPLGNCDGTVQHRKRRGNLPKEATQVLKNWFTEHSDSPYPTEDEKVYFVKVTGLHMNQISNWFINARRRAPEKLAKEELRKAQTEGRLPPQNRPQSYRRMQKRMSRDNMSPRPQNPEQKALESC